MLRFVCILFLVVGVIADVAIDPFNWFKAVRDYNVTSSMNGTSIMNAPKGAVADWLFTVNNSSDYAHYRWHHKTAEKIHLFEDHTDNKTDPYLMITVNTTNAPKKGTKRARAEAELGSAKSGSGKF